MTFNFTFDNVINHVQSAKKKFFHYMFMLWG